MPSESGFFSSQGPERTAKRRTIKVGGSGEAAEVVNFSPLTVRPGHEIQSQADAEVGRSGYRLSIGKIRFI